MSAVQSLELALLGRSLAGGRPPGRPRAPRELAGDLEGLSKSIAGGEEVEMKLFKSAIEQDRLRSRLCYEGFDSNLDIDK